MIKFTKYHGCGNNFLIARDKDIAEDLRVSDRSIEALVRRWCSVAIGVGADGLLVVTESPLQMVIYNSDGTRPPMCGNGIRCFAQYCYDQGITDKDQYDVITDAGDMKVNVVSKDPFITEINMGVPDFNPERCDIDLSGTGFPEAIETQEDFLQKDVLVDEERVTVSTVFMGTIHTIVWSEDMPNISAEVFGHSLCNHPTYRSKTNVNMAEIIDRKTIKLQTYERGVGMTAACGTGAAATVVIGIKEGKLDDEVRVLLPYGELKIIKQENGEIMMQGPSERVAEGVSFI